MELKVFLDENAVMPNKAHDIDAGFDLFTPTLQTLKGHGSVTIDTGVHVGIPEGYVGFIKSKSGLNVKRGIRGEGVIDAGYTGSIVVKLYNDTDMEHIFNIGDKITQLVILPIPEVHLAKVESVDALGDSERGANGFGSSGR